MCLLLSGFIPLFYCFCLPWEQPIMGFICGLAARGEGGFLLQPFLKAVCVPLTPPPVIMQRKGDCPLSLYLSLCLNKQSWVSYHPTLSSRQVTGWAKGSWIVLVPGKGRLYGGHTPFEYGVLHTIYIREGPPYTGGQKKNTIYLRDGPSYISGQWKNTIYIREGPLYIGG